MTDTDTGQPRNPRRGKAVILQPGELVEYGTSAWRIDRVIDLTQVLVENINDGQMTVLKMKDLKRFESAGAQPALKAPVAIDGISDGSWELARERLDIIKPLLAMQERSKRDVATRAAEVGRHTATVYRWLQLYAASSDLGSLVPRTRGPRPGTHRLERTPDGRRAEAIIAWAIKEEYLTEDRPSAQDLIVSVKATCLKAGIKCPSPSTIRARIAEVPERRRLERRGFREQSRAKFQPTPGHFPDADYPLHCVQIDHTKVDLQIVDDEHRKPIGRPWVTVAIDVYSRVIMGCYLSLDAPSATSVALCVAQAIVPKEELLLKHKIDAEWPVWGFPKTIHADNAGEFKSNNFHKACEFYDIKPKLRQKGHPEHGGHIERLIGTFMTAVHSLPGTTYSSPKEKGDLDPEQRAAMTFSEFEAWLIRYVCTVYHVKVHSEIGIPPLAKWRDGLLKSDGDKPARGLPPRPENGDDIFRTFLPRFERIVQRSGVQIDCVRYSGEALYRWTNAADPNDRRRKRKMVFRRDPRDLSSIWFHDPTLDQYFEIPAADRRFPHVSLWELRRAKQELKRRGEELVNEQQIVEAIERLRSEARASSEKTKTARREEQRRRQHQQKRKKENAEAAEAATNSEQRFSEPIDGTDDMLDEAPEGLGLW